MRKTLIILAVLAIGVPLLAVGQSRAATHHQLAAKTLTVAMHDPGCHWFSVGGKYKQSVSMRGPVSLLNMDEAALKIVGPFGTRHTAVAKKIILTKGSYRITMVGQASDDNTLKLTVA